MLAHVHQQRLRRRLHRRQRDLRQQLRLLLGLPARHHLEAEEALGHLGQDPLDLTGLGQPRRQGLGQLGAARQEPVGDLRRTIAPHVVGQDLVQDDGPEMELLLAHDVDELLGLPERGRLERAHDHERRALVVKEPLDRLGSLHEAVVHRLEQHEELGDVLEELSPEDAVRHLVEGPGGEVHDP